MFMFCEVFRKLKKWSAEKNEQNFRVRFKHYETTAHFVGIWKTKCENAYNITCWNILCALWDASRMM